MKYIAYSIYSHVDSSIKLLMMMVDMIKSIVKSIALQSKKKQKNNAACQPCYPDNPEI